MSNVDFPLLLTSLTALAAVIGPVVSTCITIRSNERLRREELHTPKVYAAISQMISAFHGLHRQGDRVTHSGWDPEQRVRDSQSAYTAFSAACFDLMSLMPNEDIRGQLTYLLQSINSTGFQVSAEHEAVFNQIIAAISWEFSLDSSKRNHSVNSQHKRCNAK